MSHISTGTPGSPSVTHLPICVHTPDTPDPLPQPLISHLDPPFVNVCAQRMRAPEAVSVFPNNRFQRFWRCRQDVVHRSRPRTVRPHGQPSRTTHEAPIPSPPNLGGSVQKQHPTPTTTPAQQHRTITVAKLLCRSRGSCTAHAAAAAIMGTSKRVAHACSPGKGEEVVPNLTACCS